MTSNSVRDGASPRDPKTAKSEPAPEQPPAKPSPAATDWLAPIQPEPTSAADWLAPAPAGLPPAEFEPEPVFEPEEDEDLDGLAGGDFDDDDFADEELDDEDAGADEAEPAVPLLQRLRRISPALVLVAAAAVVSLGALLAQLASHTSPIPILTSLAVVTGMIYAAIAIMSAYGTYRAASNGEGRLAYLLAFVGGGAAIVACGSFAGATLLVLALGL